MSLWLVLSGVAYGRPAERSSVHSNEWRHSNGYVFSTRGPSAFRLRFIPPSDFVPPLSSPMVSPDEPDAPFHAMNCSEGVGIGSSFGSICVSPVGAFSLHDASGRRVLTSLPEQSSRAQLAIATSKSSLLYGRGCSKQDATRLTAPPRLPSVGNSATYAPHYFSTDGYAALGVVGVTAGKGKTNTLPATPSVNGSVIKWSFPAGIAFELYLMPASTLDEGTLAYYQLIGKPAMPPRFAFGFLASRWGWHDRAYIESTLQAGEERRRLSDMPPAPRDAAVEALQKTCPSVSRTFRNRSLPIDAFIVDFNWFTRASDYSFPPQGEPDYLDFGYNADTFPDPKAQLADYRQRLRLRMAGIRKPRLGGTHALGLARARGYLLPGGEADAEAAAAGSAQQISGALASVVGTSLLADSVIAESVSAVSTSADAPEIVNYAQGRNLNFAKEEVREWYAGEISHYLEDGVDFWWNDEGETDYFTFYWWNVAERLALSRFAPRRRFFSLNRAFSPGMARLGATVWTGDINPSWTDLAETPGFLLNWNLAGAPYVACDIGGFTGQTNAVLLTRWFQLGVFLPTMRVHSTLAATPHFPWLWGQPHEALMRAALELRYRLLPYHYSLAHAMARGAVMWMRPMAAEVAMANADIDIDADIYADMTSQWMDGALLVAPVLREDSVKSVWLPRGMWYAFDANATSAEPPIVGPAHVVGNATLAEVPVFARAGAIIVLAPRVQSSDELPGGPLQVRVYAGANGSFTLFEDDGETTAYSTGEVRQTEFSWEEAQRTLRWTATGPPPHAVRAFTTLYAVLRHARGTARSAVLPIGDGGAVRFGV